MNNDDLKLKILAVLNHDLQSTRQIAEKVKINWYKVDSILSLLEKDCIVKKYETSGGTFWSKVKQ